MGVHGLLTIWCAPCSAWPLLRIWYGNSREFCPKPHRRAAAAARSTPSRKPRPAWRAVLCAAWAASSPQGRAMAGQGRSPCGLGGYKGGHSSAENGPPLLCRGAAARGHRRRAERSRGALPFRASVRAPSSASGPSSCAPIGNSESCCKSSVWSRRKRM